MVATLMLETIPSMEHEVAAHEARGRVRVSPAPATEPPPDDEFGSSQPSAQPIRRPAQLPDLATGAQVRLGTGDGRQPTGRGRVGPARPAPARQDHTGSGARRLGVAANVGSATGDADPRRSSPSRPAPAGSSGLTPGRASEADLRLMARRLLGMCVEILGGFRPVAQLRPYCAPERFDAIVNRLLRPAGAALGRGHGATRASVIVTAVRAGRPSRVAPEDRVTVRHVQICDVRDDVAELAVVMSRHGKSWAMAMRMEQCHGRWQCMHLEVL